MAFTAQDVKALREKTGLDEAVTTGLARIGGQYVF